MTTEEGRELISAETNLVAWLLRHGEAGAERFLSEVRSLRVVGGCTCGCASINFAADNDGTMSILADFGVTGPDGLPGGVLLFARKDRLADLPGRFVFARIQLFSVRQQTHFAR
jgi:hypothetical protein